MNTDKDTIREDSRLFQTRLLSSSCLLSALIVRFLFVSSHSNSSRTMNTDENTMSEERRLF